MKKIDNQDKEIQEISNFLNNFNTLWLISITDQQKLAEHEAEHSIVADHIIVFLDENDLEDNINGVEDIDCCISRIEQQGRNTLKSFNSFHVELL